MDARDDEELEEPVGPAADEKAELAREKRQLAAERDAFERDKEHERAAIKREKETLNEERSETSRLKQRLNLETTKYFFKKAEIEGGLVPAPQKKRGRPRDDPPAPAEAEEDGIAPEPKKRGRKKVYHSTDYGTKLPLAQLSAAGTMMNAQQLQT